MRVSWIALMLLVDDILILKLVYFWRFILDFVEVSTISYLAQIFAITSVEQVIDIVVKEVSFWWFFLGFLDIPVIP